MSCVTIVSRGSILWRLYVPLLANRFFVFSASSSPAPEVYPECWNTASGCGAAVSAAVSTWLEIGGPRLDCANSYDDETSVGAGIAAAKGVRREDYFILTKTGPPFPLGYNDTIAQFQGILQDLGVEYVDALLVRRGGSGVAGRRSAVCTLAAAPPTMQIHWPYETASQGNSTNNVTTSTDPACNMTSPAYNPTDCRCAGERRGGGAGVPSPRMVRCLPRPTAASTRGARCSTSGRAARHAPSASPTTTSPAFRSAGGGERPAWGTGRRADVPALELLQEIIDAGLELPAINQVPFNLYRSSSHVRGKLLGPSSHWNFTHPPSLETTGLPPRLLRPAPHHLQRLQVSFLP